MSRAARYTFMQLKYFISLDKSKKADTQPSRKDLWSRALVSKLL